MKTIVIAEIPLTQGKVALVDGEDFERVMQFKWYALRRPRRREDNWCAVREVYPDKFVYMHRFILDAIPGMEVDHIDGDGLNNRRSNLRLVTRQQNARNLRKQANTSSQYKGVVAFRGKWQAYIHHENRKIHLGTYESEVEAAIAYDEKAFELFGEHASFNNLRVDWQGMLMDGYEENRDR